MSPMVFASGSNPETEQWVKTWEQVPAKGKHHRFRSTQVLTVGYAELIDSPVITVDANTSVEEACEVRDIVSEVGQS